VRQVVVLDEPPPVRLVARSRPDMVSGIAERPEVVSAE
jgi:hypothetical protein